MSSNQVPNREQILGTLVHRAAAMPFAKPQRLLRGSLHPGGAGIADTVRDSALVLCQALGEVNADYAFSRADLIVDAAGPWWSKTWDDFFTMDTADRNWILAHLIDLSLQMGNELQRKATAEKWRWLWSEVPLPRPGRSRPIIVRPDLVAGIKGDKDCLLIDIKTCAKDPDRWRPDEGTVDAMRNWESLITRMDFNPVGASILLVSSGQTADGRRTAWFDLSQEAYE